MKLISYVIQSSEGTFFGGRLKVSAVDIGRLTLSWSAGLGLGAGAIGEGSRRSSSHQGFVSVRPAVVSSGGARCKMLSTVSTEGYRQGLIAESRRGAYSVAIQTSHLAGHYFFIYTRH